MTAPHTVTQIQDALQKYPLNPVDVKKAWTEMTHRYLAGIEGILILVLSFSILLQRTATGTKLTCIALALSVCLGIQVTLGMLTVTAKLKPVIVLAHLLTGISILCLLWWAYLAFHLPRPTRSNTPTRLTPWLGVGIIILFLQISLGGWVTTHYAGLACIDFPYCNGTLLPPLQLTQFHSDLITIHMLHRLGALFTAIYWSILSVFLWRQPTLRGLGGMMLFLLAAQLTLGVLNLLWLRPISIALAHQTVGILLLLTAMTTLIKTHYPTKDNEYGTWLA